MYWATDKIYEGRYLPDMSPGPDLLQRGVLACIALYFCACASTQKIAVDCTPKQSTLYVDGEALSEIPTELELRSDRDHKLFFKGPRSRPELVILYSKEVAGKMQLQPARVCVEAPSDPDFDRELELEVEGRDHTPTKTHSPPIR